MHTYVIFTILAILISQPFVVKSYVCPKCSELTCQEVSCAKDQVLKQKSYCGCCDVCFDVMAEGEHCGTRLLGVFEPYECAEGLVCIGEQDSLILTCQKEERISA